MSRERNNPRSLLSSYHRSPAFLQKHHLLGSETLRRCTFHPTNMNHCSTAVEPANSSYH
uniref:Uncharacterized protein n=1 Tax=Parascaris equorum TaxID=6256 RepID=A0A914RKX9_PAREQ